MLQLTHLHRSQAATLSCVLVPLSPLAMQQLVVHGAAAAYQLLLLVHLPVLLLALVLVRLLSLTYYLPAARLLPQLRLMHLRLLPAQQVYA